MKSKGMVGLLALIMAAVATAAMFLYVRGVRENAQSTASTIDIVVAKEDIPAGTNLDDLITEGAFTSAAFDESVVIEGAVRDLEELQGRTTAVPILANEQISSARLQGSQELAGGVLGIPANHEAMTLALDAQRQVGRDVVAGDHITIFGSFKPPVNDPAVTVNIVNDVRVLKVFTNEIVAGDDDAQETMMTLALRPRDIQRVVFAKEHGTVWYSLLAPGEGGTDNRPVTIDEVKN